MAKKSAEKLGVGIVGCGLMGGIHAECYDRSGQAPIVACYNRTPDKAQALAKKYGAKIYDTVEELVADPAVKIVSVCTAQEVHHPNVMAALKAGKHVLCEKPVALTPAELNEIDVAIKKAGVTFMVAHQLRFHPVLKAVKAALPKLGPVFHLDLEMCFRITADKGRCWADYRTGGFFMELGVHLVDMAQGLMGPIENVSGHTLRLNPRRITEDYTNCLLQFQSKAVGSIIVSANHRTTRQGLLMGRVIGAKGRIDFTIYPYATAMNKAVMTLDKGKAIFVPDATVTTLKWKHGPSLSKTYPGFYDVYQQEIEAFLNCVRTGAEPPISFAAGRAAVEGVLAVYDAQGKVTAAPNFAQRAGQYRSDGSCHPALGGK